MRRYILLFLLIVMAGCTQKKSGVLIIGHRGASSVAPENTLAAFQKAIDFGADYFELDVWLSKDDSLIVIHDDSLHRTTNGTGLVAEYTYAELLQLDAGSWFDPQFAGEKLPTLRQALQLARAGDIKVCIEVKSPDAGIIPQILNLVEKLSMQDRVILFSFDANQVAEAKGINSEIPALYLLGDIEMTDIDFARQIHADAVGVGGEVTKEIVTAAHNHGLEFWKWTVNEADEMRDLIDMGVDGIITNYPQRLKKVLAENSGG